MQLIRPRDVRTLIEFQDGTTITVREIFADQVRWDTDRAKRGWPGLTESPILATGYMAWAAAVREGKFTGSWDQFCAQVVDTTKITVDGREIVYRDGRPFADDEPANMIEPDTFDDADPTTPATTAEH